jgi:hypothetical protein
MERSRAHTAPASSARVRVGVIGCGRIAQLAAGTPVERPTDVAAMAART